MVKLAVPFLLLALILSGCKSTVLESRPVSPNLQFTFSIPQRAHVKLTVEDMYNSIVATPLDADMPEGTHNIDFKIKNFTAGVYYYIIEAKGIDNNYYEKSIHNINVALL